MRIFFILCKLLYNKKIIFHINGYSNIPVNPFELVPTMLILKDIRHKVAPLRCHYLDQLYADFQTGDFIEFTFVEPSYYNIPNIPTDDQHPIMMLNLKFPTYTMPLSTAFIFTYGFNCTDSEGN